MGYKKTQKGSFVNSGIKFMNRRNTLSKRLKLLKGTKQILELKNSINEMKSALESNGYRADTCKKKLANSKVDIQK